MQTKLKTSKETKTRARWNKTQRYGINQHLLASVKWLGYKKALEAKKKMWKEKNVEE